MHLFFFCVFIDGHLGYFHILAVVNNATVNPAIRISFWISDLIFRGYKLKIRIAGSPIFSFWGTSVLFFIVVVPVYLPTVKWSESCSLVSDSLWPHGLYSPWNSPSQNTGVGSCSLLQGIFPTQGSNPGLPHCRWILYHLSHNTFPLVVHKRRLFSVRPSALVICHLFDNSYSDRWCWHLIAVLIFISLMINDVEHLFFIFLFFWCGRHLFLSSGSWEPKIKVSADSVSGRAPHPCSQPALLPMSSLSRRGEGALWDLLCKGTNPSKGDWASSHVPIGHLCLLWKNVDSGPLPILKSRFLVCLLFVWSCMILCILRIVPPYWTYHLQMSSTIQWMAFCLLIVSFTVRKVFRWM